ncbi:MAG: DUF58 domain-containing protein [Methylococcales bacterium]|nr:DUF58 domain-containing protein [Methylococcales bacterium]
MNIPSLKKRLQLSRFFSGEKTIVTPITLNQRRVFILPTHRGLNFALLTALLLLIAFVYNNNLIYLLAFLLSSVFFITILHTYRSLAGLVLQEGQAKAVFAGEAAGFDIHINNPLTIDRQYLHIVLEEGQYLSVKALSNVTVTLYSATQKRGWHTAGTVTLSSTYPLGLFRAWSPIRFNLKTLVYPKPSALELPFPEVPSEQAQQGFSLKEGDEFHGLKSYEPGDPIKHIYWKAFAKGQGLFSKQFGGENSAQIWLDYNYAPGHDTEERLSQMCRWVIDAERLGLAFGFSLPGLKLPPDSGLLHTRKCLEALALF